MLGASSGKTCFGGFDPREFIIQVMIAQAVDVALTTWQIIFVYKNQRESLGIMALRFLQLIGYVVILIIGNVNYYDNNCYGCDSLKTISFIIIIFGYFEMLKCCCIGTLLCLFIPIIIYAARQQQQPNWMPAPPNFV